MKWNDQQNDALIAIDHWLGDSTQQVFRLFGYAGTGKTTMAKTIAEHVDGGVLFGAFTGKAAHVLRQKGCPMATTIHAHIYHTHDKGRAKLKELESELGEVLMELNTVELAEDIPEQRKKIIDENQTVKTLRSKIKQEKEALSQPAFSLNHDSAVKDAKVIMIDECSMVDDRMGEDLQSFGTKILVMGDPAQLPPVRGSGFFTENVVPDIMLTEIHRQAADNPIIAMATKVRQEESLQLGSYGESRVVEQVHINYKDALAVDQILVGKNATRHITNNRVRSLLGRTEQLPVPEDKLVCLRNNHEKGLLNGAIWFVEDIGEVGEERLYMTILSEDDAVSLGVEAHTHYFLGAEDKLGWWERKEAEEFDYGYSLTVHKSQGSQWKSVMLFDESYCFRKDRWRWLYTGLTRASERVTLVRT